ncbi:MAG: hypothetical protein E6I78_01165 [Chloroflexi bacterium]|nr:MAG: hypothetical protein E6I78_01165 [Chloroflexota bacterium]
MVSTSRRARRAALQSSSVLRRSTIRATPRLTLPRLSEGRSIFGLALCLYGLVASVMVFAANIIQGDALSRVGNAEYVLYSHDPHLAAIGFVWNPLPSLLIMPLLPLKVLFPQLVERGFAANIVSCVFMAGAVYQLWHILSDLGLHRGWRLLLTLLFALHPMVVFYGANGMSEAPFLFFLILATRCLAAWLATPRLEWQVYTGLSLGAAYLCPARRSRRPHHRGDRQLDTRQEGFRPSVGHGGLRHGHCRGAIPAGGSGLGGGELDHRRSSLRAVLIDLRQRLAAADPVTAEHRRRWHRWPAPVAGAGAVAAGGACPGPAECRPRARASGPGRAGGAGPGARLCRVGARDRRGRSLDQILHHRHSAVQPDGRRCAGRAGRRSPLRQAMA